MYVSPNTAAGVPWCSFPTARKPRKISNLTREQHAMAASTVSEIDRRIAELQRLLAPAMGSSMADDLLRVQKALHDRVVRRLDDAWTFADPSPHEPAWIVV